MPSFASFTNILPDPVNIIGRAGQADPAGTPGAGFASVTLSSSDNFLNTVTNSGRAYTVSAYHHKWMVDITYNSLTRAEFDPVYTFLLHKKVTLEPFYVALPQYASQTLTGVTVLGNHSKDSSILTVNTTTPTIPPQIFSIGSNSKIYMISHAETNTDYNFTLGQPAVDTERYHIIPELTTDITNATTLTFVNPLLYVQQVGETIEYSIGDTNLYSFSLKLEEVAYV